MDAQLESRAKNAAGHRRATWWIVAIVAVIAVVAVVAGCIAAFAGRKNDTTGAKARWWVDDQARYCREWLDGKLKGNTGCMNVEFEDGQVALYSEGKKVVEGVLGGK